MILKPFSDAALVAFLNYSERYFQNRTECTETDNLRSKREGMSVMHKRGLESLHIFAR